MTRDIDLVIDPTAEAIDQFVSRLDQSLDGDYLSRWAGELGIEGELDRALRAAGD